MSDTKHLFRPLADVSVPDLWDRIASGRADPPSATFAPHPKPSRRKAALAAVATVAVTAGIVGVLATAFPSADVDSPLGSNPPGPRLVVRLGAGTDGSPPEATITYGEATTSIPPQGGEGWGMEGGFDDVGYSLDAEIPLGTAIEVAGDADEVSVAVQACCPLRGVKAPVALVDGLGTLDGHKGELMLVVTGTWPDGIAEFTIFLHIERKVTSPGDTTTVPDLTGLTMQEATRALEEAGLSLGTVETGSSDEVAKGLAIGSDPAAGEDVDGGTEVDILMSAGPLASLPTVMSLHERVEAALSDLWTELALTSEMEGQIKAAHHGLQTLSVEIGEREPTAEQTREINQLKALIASFEESITERAAAIEKLRAEIETLRARLDKAVRQASPAALPTIVIVRCMGDGWGGTALSTPAVIAQQDGVHIRVVNEIPNEPVFLDLGIGGEPIEVAAGDEVEHVLQNPPPRMIAVVCKYETPPQSWERPAHHLVVI